MRWQDTRFSLWCPMHPGNQPTPPTPTPPPVPQFHPQYSIPPWFLPHPAQKLQTPPGHQPQSPQVPPGQQSQPPQMLQFPQPMYFPKYFPWNPYPVSAPPDKMPSTTTSPQITASKTGSQPLFPPFFYPMPLSLYPPSLPWGGLLYPPVAGPPVKSKANQPAHMLGFGYSNYPYNFAPLPFPQHQPKLHPPKVHPYYYQFG